MTLSFLELLSVLALPALLGAALLRWQGVGPRTDPLAYGGWCWIQGALGLALVLEIWLWLGWPLRAIWLAPAVLALAVLVFLLGRRRPLRASAARGARGARERAFPTWERACFALVLAFLLIGVLDRAFVATGDPIVDSDEAFIWTAKAKAMYTAGDFGPVFGRLVRTEDVVGHGDYPPLNPLLQTWVFAHAGEIVYVESRVPIQAFGIAFVLVVAGALRRRARPLVAAAFLAWLGAVGFTRFSIYHAFSDLLVACGAFVCWDLWQRFQDDGDTLWLALLGTMAPLLVWSKNEGVLLVLAALGAWSAARLLGRVRLPEPLHARRVLAWAVPLCASIVYLVWFNKHFGLESDLLRGSRRVGDPGAKGFVQNVLAHGAERVLPILRHFAGRIGDLEMAAPLCAFLVLVVLAPASAFGRARLTFTLGLLLALAGYMAVYLGTFWNLEEHLATSAHRLVYHLVPAAGLWVLLFVLEVLPGLRPDAVPG